MDSQEAKTENFELPKPAGEAASTTETGAPEKGPAPEQQTVPGAADPGAAQTATTPLADPAALQTGSTPAVPTVSGHTAGLAADDADLIEKTWVEKAKQIVAQTHGDPYTQNKEINKVKADYIKKRYNKDIKLASE